MQALRASLVCLGILTLVACKDETASTAKDAVAPAGAPAAATTTPSGEAKLALMRDAGIAPGLYRGVSADGAICELDLRPDVATGCVGIVVKKKDVPFTELEPADLVNAESACNVPAPTDCSVQSSAAPNDLKLAAAFVAESAQFSQMQVAQDPTTRTLSMKWFEGGSHFVRPLSCLGLRSSLFFNRPKISCTGLTLQQ
jgi:hypothetical protein